MSPAKNGHTGVALSCDNPSLCSYVGGEGQPLTRLGKPGGVVTLKSYLTSCTGDYRISVPDRLTSVRYWFNDRCHLAHISTDCLITVYYSIETT